MYLLERNSRRRPSIFIQDISPCLFGLEDLVTVKSTWPCHFKLAKAGRAAWLLWHPIKDDSPYLLYAIYLKWHYVFMWNITWKLTIEFIKLGIWIYNKFKTRNIKQSFYFTNKTCCNDFLLLVLCRVADHLPLQSHQPIIWHVASSRGGDPQTVWAPQAWAQASPDVYRLRLRWL